MKSVCGLALNLCLNFHPSLVSSVFLYFPLFNSFYFTWYLCMIPQLVGRWNVYTICYNSLYTGFSEYLDCVFCFVLCVQLWLKREIDLYPWLLTSLCTLYLHTNWHVFVQNGWTPLITASYYGHTDICQMLVNKGAEMNHQNEVIFYFGSHIIYTNIWNSI